MTTAAENEILTRTGPGTQMGELMRQYWIPALKSTELVADGDPVRFELLSERLIAFRDTSGKVGVMDHRCPHRCASLFFGRNEEGGIRCVYHGWKFDTDGNCLDMANVPPHQDFKHKVHAKAYKAAERNGVVYVYMGKAQDAPPPLPPLEAALLNPSDAEVRFVHRECNWLQAAEGELDTSHIGFLHFGLLGKNQMEGQGENKFAVTNRAPEYKSQETDFGYVYAAYRPAEGDETYWRFGQFAFPFWTMPPIGHIKKNLLTRAYVPIDDDNCMLVIIEQKGIIEETGIVPPGHPGQAHAENYLPNTTDWQGRWKLIENRANDYLIDRERQRNECYTGMDTFVLQDQMITESMGEIVDRTMEHLAPSDVMITRVRRCLLRAAQAYAKDGSLPPSATDASLFDGVRGGHFVAKSNVEWLEAYRALVPTARAGMRETQQAAE